MLNKEKGITLISLIITIIVMLILVGVTINVALNGGLFEKAETATRATEEKAILEEMLAMMDITDEGKINYSAIITKMKEKYGEEKVKYTYPNATITGKLGTYNYIVSETEIKIGPKGDVPEPFDWTTVGLIVDTSTAYKGYIEPLNMDAIVSFTEDGKVIIESNGFITEINAKNPDNIDDTTGKLSFSLEIVSGTNSNIVITMNENNTDIDAQIQGLGTITYEKMNNDNVYSNEEVLKMLGITNSTGTYTGTWTVLESGADGKPTKLVSTSNVTRYTLGYGDPKAIKAIPAVDESAPTEEEKEERAIWSYKNAAIGEETLNTAAKEATGISSARSITVDDIELLAGIQDSDKGNSYGIVYNFYYDAEKQQVCSKYKTGEDTWSEPYNTGYSSKSFVNNEGETVVVGPERGEMTVIRSYYSYTLTETQKADIGTLASGYYWLASTCIWCDGSYTERFWREMRKWFRGKCSIY